MKKWMRVTVGLSVAAMITIGGLGCAQSSVATPVPALREAQVQVQTPTPTPTLDEQFEAGVRDVQRVLKAEVARRGSVDYTQVFVNDYGWNEYLGGEKLSCSAFMLMYDILEDTYGAEDAAVLMVHKLVWPVRLYSHLLNPPIRAHWAVQTILTDCEEHAQWLLKKPVEKRKRNLCASPFADCDLAGFSAIRCAHPRIASPVLGDPDSRVAWPRLLGCLGRRLPKSL